jgi:hypothetical protein
VSGPGSSHFPSLSTAPRSRPLFYRFGSNDLFHSWPHALQNMGWILSNPPGTGFGPSTFGSPFFTTFGELHFGHFVASDIFSLLFIGRVRAL